MTVKELDLWNPFHRPLIDTLTVTMQKNYLASLFFFFGPETYASSFAKSQPWSDNCSDNKQYKIVDFFVHA